MKITASALSLNVDDVARSAEFANKHFGFGPSTFKPDHMRGRRADGLLVVFVVDDIDGGYTRLQREGVPMIELLRWMTETNA